MGLSKRNPKGNFNWQSRYLKRKAICCGQLDDPALTPCYNYFKFSAIGLTSYTIFDPTYGTYGPLIGDNVINVAFYYQGQGINATGSTWYDVEVFPGDPPNLMTCTMGFLLPSSGTPPPIDIRDPLGNPVTLTYSKCCRPVGCYSTFIGAADNIVTEINTGLDGYVIKTFNPLAGISPNPFDLSDPFTALGMEGFLVRMYGFQMDVVIVTEDLGYRIYFNNVCACGTISLKTSSGASYPMTSVTC